MGVQGVPHPAMARVEALMVERAVARRLFSWELADLLRLVADFPDHFPPAKVEALLRESALRLERDGLFQTVPGASPSDVAGVEVGR